MTIYDFKRHILGMLKIMVVNPNIGMLKRLTLTMFKNVYYVTAITSFEDNRHLFFKSTISS